RGSASRGRSRNRVRSGVLFRSRCGKHRRVFAADDRQTKTPDPRSPTRCWHRAELLRWRNYGAMSADAIARALKARRSGTGWIAKCPAHDDRNPSLSIRDADGKVLFHCHAGCGQHEVIEALKGRGLWAERPAKARRKIVATYDYTDEAGQLLYQVVRTEPKGFFQRRPDGDGGWINRKCKRQVLFHLPEVVEAPIVFVAEGEKDVETLRSQGF